MLSPLPPPPPPLASPRRPFLAFLFEVIAAENLTQTAARGGQGEGQEKLRERTRVLGRTAARVPGRSTALPVSLVDDFPMDRKKSIFIEKKLG